MFLHLQAETFQNLDIFGANTLTVRGRLIALPPLRGFLYLMTSPMILCELVW